MNRLKNKVIVITGATKGVGRAFARAAAEEGAIIVGGGRDEAAGIEMMKESERSGHEGLRQLYKQFENILNPRDIVAQSRGKASAIAPQLREMHALVKKCVEDGGIPYPTLQKIFKDQYGMTVEAFADATGELARLIKMN